MWEEKRRRLFLFCSALFQQFVVRYGLLYAVRSRCFLDDGSSSSRRRRARSLLEYVDLSDNHDDDESAVAAAKVRE